MSDVTEQPTSPPTAGSLLRAARQAQGLHIAALAATIKVSHRKLELLEADRLDELPDATFTRALAQTVCRALKIDAAPVLALLPAPAGPRLEQVSEGINAPFRDRPGRHEPAEWAARVSPGMWGALFLVILAAAVYLLPQDWLPRLQPLLDQVPAPAPAASAVVPVVAAPSVAPQPDATVVAQAASAPAVEPAVPPGMPAGEAVASANEPAPAPAPAASAAATAETALHLRTTAASWVVVHDARSQVLLSRIVQPGESLTLDGAVPLRVKIGNARATQVVFRGRPLDLAANTRGNVANLELR
jgi:cytoskeleton protein RodZ